jgi:hypothetical protein
VARPKKLSGWRRETIPRDYVGLCDAAEINELEHPYRDDFIRILARYHRTSRRQVIRRLDESDLSRIQLENKNFWRGLAYKKFLKSLNEMRDKKN